MNTSQISEFPILNGSGDLGIDGAIRPYIGQQVQFLKVCKSGLYQILTDDGHSFTVPKRNLTELPRSQHVYAKPKNPDDWLKAQHLTYALGSMITAEATQAELAKYSEKA